MNRKTNRQKLNVKRSKANAITFRKVVTGLVMASLLLAFMGIVVFAEESYMPDYNSETEQGTMPNPMEAPEPDGTGDSVDPIKQDGPVDSDDPMEQNDPIEQDDTRIPGDSTETNDSEGHNDTDISRPHLIPPDDDAEPPNELTVDTIPEKTPVYVEKRDAVTDSLVAGAIFKLTDGNGSHDLLTGIVSESVGSVKVSELTAGTYRLYEVSPSVGYAASNVGYKEFSVCSTKNSQGLTITFTNEKEYGIRVQKIDGSSRQPLSGAEFNICYNADGSGVLGSVRTNADGIADMSTRLTRGTYYMVETKAPEGYNKLTSALRFDVSASTADSSAVVIVIVENTLAPTPIPTPIPTPTLPTTIPPVFIEQPPEPPGPEPPRGREPTPGPEPTAEPEQEVGIIIEDPEKPLTLNDFFDRLKDDGLQMLIPDLFEIPLYAGPGTGYHAWALVNLILAIAGALLAIITAIRVLVHMRDEKDDDVYETDYVEYGSEPEKEKQTRLRLLWILTSLITGIAGIIVFLLTEDMRLPMFLVNRWTIVNAIIFIIGVIAYIFEIKRDKDDDDPEMSEVNRHLRPVRR